MDFFPFSLAAALSACRASSSSLMRPVIGDTTGDRALADGGGVGRYAKDGSRRRAVAARTSRPACRHAARTFPSSNCGKEIRNGRNPGPSSVDSAALRSGGRAPRTMREELALVSKADSSEDVDMLAIRVVMDARR